MVECFASRCNHRTCRETCGTKSIPKDPKRRKLWEDLCRRDDRKAKDGDRVCTCHFQKGKDHPTIFQWNPDPITFVDPTVIERAIKRRKKEIQEKDLAAATSSNIDQYTAFETSSDIDITDPSLDHEHNYSLTSEGGAACAKYRDTQIESLKAEVKGLESKLRLMSLQPKLTAMSIAHIKDSEKKMLLYTSVTYEVFILLHQALSKFKIKYYQGWNVTYLSTKDQLLLTLIKLKRNPPDLDLAHRFQVSEATVSNVFYTYLHALHELLFDGILRDYVPSMLKCKGSQPASFAEFSSCRLVMDATEITMDIPPRMDQKAQSYSSYKSRHTVKSVLSVAPNAAIVQISELYPGSTSDNRIVERCGIVKKLKPGDVILADKGFTIESLLPAGVSANIPSFLVGKAHFTRQEAELNYKIARARIHVERANERVKNFDILDHIPCHYRPIATKIFQVCAALVNLQAPLLKEVFSQAES